MYTTSSISDKSHFLTSQKLDLSKKTPTVTCKWIENNYSEVHQDTENHTCYLK